MEIFISHFQRHQAQRVRFARDLTAVLPWAECGFQVLY